MPNCAHSLTQTTRQKVLAKFSAIFLALFLSLAALAPLADPAAAAFPGRPGPIAFQSTRAGGLSIWLVNRDGSGLRQFTEGGGGSRSPRLRQYAPAISPSGDSVAYVSSQEVRDGSWNNLFVKGIGVRSLNNPGRRVLRSASPRAIESVAFAPGGRRLVFSAVPRRGGPDFELFTVGVGGGLRQLTFNRVQDVEPTVSRRGLIAFARVLRRDKPGLAVWGPSDIALIRPGWRRPRLLTKVAARRGEDRSPNFAPSGNQVAHERRFLNPATAGRIMETDLRSKRSRPIFTGIRNDSSFDEPGNPAFSPSGKSIVFDRTFTDDRGGITAADLYEIRRDGGGLRYVSGQEEEYETEADWGPRR